MQLVEMKISLKETPLRYDAPKVATIKAAKGNKLTGETYVTHPETNAIREKGYATTAPLQRIDINILMPIRTADTAAASFPII